MRFDRLTAVCTSLETIYRQKYKDNKNIYLIVRHETLQSTLRYGVQYRLWVEIMNEDVERDIRVTGHIVQGQVEEITPKACIMTEDEFEEMIFHNLEGDLITELIKYFYDKIM